MAVGALPFWQSIALAAAAGAPSRVFESLLWFGAIVAVLMLGAVLASWARRRFRATEPPVPGGVDLAVLEQRDEGLVSPAEYEAVRYAVLKSLKNEGARHGE